MLLKVFGRPTIQQRRLHLILLSQRYRRSFTISMNTHDSSDDFFRYTSGRWLYDEEIQLRRRYFEFNVQALKECASRELGTNIKFAAHGSIYYKSTYPDGPDAVSLDQLPSSKHQTGSRFVIGPTTERSFYVDGIHGQSVDQGPWGTAQEYLSAVARREISLIRNPDAEKPSDSMRLFSGTRAAAPENHSLLLEQFMAILPHILPASDITRPTLMHHDLHLDNIFVNDTDPTKISSIIDWQATYASPLFLQARFPSVFDCDDPYPWGAIQPSLPKDFDMFSPAEKEAAKEALARLRLKKFYEMASRKFNPILFTAIDMTRNHDDPTSFIFHIIGQSAFDGPVPLEELLIQIYEQWGRITERKGLNVPCPLSFTEEEIKKKRQKALEWSNIYGEFESLRAVIAGKDGWVSHDEYEEAMRIFKRHRGRLEVMRARLEQLS